MKNSIFLKTLLILFFFFSGTGVVLSVTPPDTSYTLLEPGIFGKTSDSKFTVTSFNDYASKVFTVVLGAAIALAILMIVLGGFEYITSATGAGKGDGKKKIYDALTGLVILLLSWLALNTINPDLVNWTFKVEQLGEKPDTSN